MSSDDTERYAIVRVVAPDGSTEDTVKVQFDYEQPLGIDPLHWHGEGHFPSDYKLELVYIVADGTQYLEDETRSVDTATDHSETGEKSEGSVDE